MKGEIRQDILIERIKEKMVHLKLNQASLAGAAGITPAALSQILNKERVPSSVVLLKLATALDESIDFLVGRVDKTDVSVHLQNPEVMELYTGFSELTRPQKDQIFDMISYLKQKK
jgi:transcriptional regulator with XRE-family HTH domain